MRPCPRATGPSPRSLVRRPFGRQHLLVELELAAGEPGHALAQEPPLQPCRAARGQARGGDGAGVDHRVGESLGSQLDRHHRVERQAGGVDAEPVADLAVPERLTHEREQERLGNALDRERVLAVTDAGDLPVHPRDGNAEEVRIGQRERRDVVGDLPVGDPRIAVVRSRDDLEDLFRARQVTGRDLHPVVVLEVLLDGQVRRISPSVGPSVEGRRPAHAGPLPVRHRHASLGVPESPPNQLQTASPERPGAVRDPVFAGLDPEVVTDGRRGAMRRSCRTSRPGPRAAAGARCRPVCGTSSRGATLPAPQPPWRRPVDRPCPGAKALVR